MPNFRRRHVNGGSYFFTVVTNRRQPFLASELARPVLRNAIENVRKTADFEIVAFVLLPDHLHTIWALPDGDDDYSLRWRGIKTRFTREYLAKGGKEAILTEGRQRKQERGIWQARFWEHTIENDHDLSRCLDYIHWNPVKHGLVARPVEYPWSTFQKFVDLGEYTPDWGTGHVTSEVPGAEWD